MKPVLTFAAAIILLPACGVQKDTDYNLALISIDTLRADHLGCYGYPRNTSPNIDRFADEATVFLNAYSTAPKTAESHMSMFTSLYPSVHRVFTVIEEAKINVLDENISTLPQLLNARGYTTVGFHGGGFVDEKFGFGRGFDVYRKSSQGEAEAWLKENAAKGKFFLFYHTYAVHDPYTPSPPYDTLFDSDYHGKIVHDPDVLVEMSGSSRRRQLHEVYWDRVDKNDPVDVGHLIALYDGAIAEMDSELGNLFNSIETYAPQTVVIFLSDHGEAFGEHNGVFLHSQMYNEAVHVPLIIKHPDKPGGAKIKDRVSLIDLAPTILNILSIEPVEQFQGKPLTEDGGKHHQGQIVFSEYPGQSKLAVIGNDKKLISKKQGFEFYNLLDDPEELHNLANVDNAELDFLILKDALNGIANANKGSEKALNRQRQQDYLTQETIDGLKALGYIK